MDFRNILSSCNTNNPLNLQTILQNDTFNSHSQNVITTPEHQHDPGEIHYLEPFRNASVPSISTRSLNVSIDPLTVPVPITQLPPLFPRETGTDPSSAIFSSESRVQEFVTAPLNTESEREGDLLERKTKETEEKKRTEEKKTRGRPKGSKKKVMSDSDTSKNDSGRGQGFSKRNGLCIAKAWVHQSRKGPNQRETALYESVAKICKDKYKISRTPDSIRCFWSRLAKETQIYLACESSIKRRRVSGANKEAIDSLVMDLYRRRNSTKQKDGNSAYAPPFRYIDAAHYLQGEPKFSAKYMGEDIGSPSNVDEGHGTVEDDPDKKGTSVKRENGVVRSYSATESGSDRGGRPMGMKRRKREEKLMDEAHKSNKAIEDLTSQVQEANTLYKESNEFHKKSTKNIRDIRLLQALPPTSSEYRRILADVMRAREEEQEGTGSVKKTDGKHGNMDEDVEEVGEEEAEEVVHVPSDEESM